MPGRSCSQLALRILDWKLRWRNGREKRSSALGPWPIMRPPRPACF